jgi:hypothetical protein
MRIWKVYIKDDRKIWDIINVYTYSNTKQNYKSVTKKILWTNKKGRLVLLDILKWVF